MIIYGATNHKYTQRNVYLIDKAADFRSAYVDGSRAARETDLERHKAGLHTSGCTSTGSLICSRTISIHQSLHCLN